MTAPATTAWDDRASLAIRTVVSLIVLSVGLWIITKDGYPDATIKWAYGAVGIILGYWLR
jgi:hypothetical protein